MKYNLSSFENPTADNLGGLCTLYFVPREWVQFPVVISLEDNSVQDPLTLIPGKSWLQGKPLQETAMLEENEQRTEAGVMFVQRVSFQVMMDSLDISSALTALYLREYIVLVKDNNGRMKLIGNTRKGMTSQMKVTTGNNVVAKNHYALEWSHESDAPAPFYRFGI